MRADDPIFQPSELVPLEAARAMIARAPDPECTPIKSTGMPTDNSS
jgi:hypothetical protein